MHNNPRVTCSSLLTSGRKRHIKHQVVLYANQGGAVRVHAGNSLCPIEVRRVCVITEACRGGSLGRADEAIVCK